jgi:uncharacterized OB-fold protein
MIEDLAPIPDDLTQEWWDATREDRLLLQHCGRCEHVQHYPRVVCVACGSFELSWIPSRGRGVVDSFTVVHRAPHPELQTPYVIARIRLDEGPTILSRIVSSEESQLSCDARVALDWMAIPGGYKLPVFRIDQQ